ncbi:hypothetical protein O2W14_05475 [Modestobacter sp. VKM Ac-2986]|uniref:hypothetical protein n=1 Tax=Modestobacter sp. VKM Ac-2986 TaxID=3004140 RepID=UPI0022AA2683|nr:hypothetical protein [Modestobacter sp. VKM Ac-2986]MCZ2828283.1 hypothetical protein [Modestobacter sp. VKM Ac-2986]
MSSTAAVLVFIALGALVTGLLRESTELTWVAFIASVLAVGVLVAGELGRRRAGTDDGARSPVAGTGRGPTSTVRPGGPAAAPLRSVLDDDLSVRRVSPPPVPPSSPDVYGRGRRPRTEDLGDLTGADIRYTGTRPVDGRAPTSSSHAAPDGPAAPRVEAFPGRASPIAPSRAADREPPAEDVDMTDLLLVLDLTDEVMVVDRHPRYHLERCPYLLGHQAVALPISEARADGFTPCSTCGPIRLFAARERARRSV